MADPRLHPSGSAPRRDEPTTDGTGRRLYNPYQDLNIPYKNLYDLPTSPEFLFQEEALVQRRSWGENLTYYTGIGYLSGALAGAALGLREAAAGAEPADTAKIRANRVLNSCGAAGRRVGNRLGVIGLLYAGMESGMVAARDGQDDWVNSVVAGLGTGALFRAANGTRSAAVAGAVGGVLAGAALAAKQAAKRYQFAL
ncbi:mitochondrial import inner membrane translocase subunit TIM23-1-like [Lolium rigidum]|uniref:mitochondrial import inner membrane translocase subunit TIM23-1-like n=1 Tax=Lolium rigidum TaxID=89674 RepID=UPI001F5C67DF|nr:mitochondrial import inner membrane translocase subunit TIM23-1-like [Lolium rigidum]